MVFNVSKIHHPLSELNFGSPGFISNKKDIEAIFGFVTIL